MSDDGVDFDTMDFDDVLAHYGIKRRSGRYPWGSGNNNPNQRNKDFLSYVDKLSKDGISQTDIARGLGITTTQLRAMKSIARTQQRAADEAYARQLKERGLSNVAIGERMGRPESSVRALLDPAASDRNKILDSTAKMLRDEVARTGSLDIGTGVENHLGISQTKLKTAVAILEEEGYRVHYLKVEQLGTGKDTTVKVLAEPEVTWTQLNKDRANIGSVSKHSDDGGRSYLGLRDPENVSSKRLEVRYGKDGGAEMDGVMEIRRGVPDLDMGNARYAQVRIAVDGTHYIKGMAIYADDLPDGVDIRFNTNKESTGNKLDALKGLKTLPDGGIDMDNPFGATIKPGGQRGALNILNEEGDWGKWSKNLPAQMLSKQRPELAKQQLDMKYESKRQEYDEIMALNNPAVKAKLLQSFADGVDSASIHLKAAALPRQASHAILPINSIKEGEIYAPNYRNGEKVVLVRFPHGGKFEIPELTVNNKNADAKRLIPGAKDAVGINSKVAARLSGADFDGDTVLVIPNNNRAVKTSAPLAALKDFDPQSAYPSYPGMPKMSAKTKQLKMGDVSNLITDMTIQGANDNEIARAVRHSMVVIDAEKHNLNWKQSALDNGIAELKTKYQGSARAGAATLISRASSEVRIAERKARPASEGGAIDKATGEKRYVETDASYVKPAYTKVDKNGKIVQVPEQVIRKTTKITRMEQVRDANALSSGTPMEAIYANHANKLKALANTARKSMVNTKSVAYSPTAAKAYAKEVSSLNAKLNVALKNAPLERRAQLIANATVSAKRQANPGLEAADIKKIKNQALAEARTRTGAGKQQIEIGWDEWNAIQAGAISNNRLKKILDNADLDNVKQLATPRTPRVMTDAKIRRAQAMVAAGYTQSEIADQLGVPTSTLNDALS